MRLAIREQLAALVVFLVLLALCIVSVPTWIFVHSFVVNVESDALSLTASLKASRITADLELVQTSCYTITSRILLQHALQAFYAKGEPDWAVATNDLSSALSIGNTTGLLQTRIFSRNATGGGRAGLLNVTAPNVPDITLPFSNPEGNPVKLGDSDLGYPPELYPNITYKDLGHQNTIRNNTTAYGAEAFPNVRISQEGGLLLGPLILNSTSALISLSVPIRDNSDRFILGYMTMVALSNSLIDVRDSREGLGRTGMVLVIGPTTPWNRFNISLPASNATFLPNAEKFKSVDLRFVLPPQQPSGKLQRHDQHGGMTGTYQLPFQAKDYPAAYRSLTTQIDTVNNASAMLSTSSEDGKKVSVGFARTSTALIDWTVIVEKERAEAYEPTNTLQNILLGTVFGTVGLILLIIFPIAHLSVLPIRKLKAATEKSIAPPGYEDVSSDSEDERTPGSGRNSHRSKKGLVMSMVRLFKRRPKREGSSRDSARRMFKIPGKVTERRHLIRDELTELTTTFNDMSDEIFRQYVSLDEKVAERTRELTESKKAAEAANESKTLFIANISHELKTPLNGILGMCAVCMEETDMLRIKQSLKTLYKSGDLLLHLLEDLLSFSKNQIGHQLKMEFREFRLADIRSQIVTVFDKQVREGKVDLAVNFIGTSENLDLGSDSEHHPAIHEKMLPALGPQGSGRLKDMCLYGDQHRILQVLINLVSNSLKFTPPGGRVQVRIKCLEEVVDNGDDNVSRTSSTSRNSRHGRSRYRGTSGSSQSLNTSHRGSVPRFSGTGTALSINPMDPSATPYVQFRERSLSPPPPLAKTFTFEFEVQDSGPGIPENMQQKVFEPFVQGDLGLSKKFGGTGLGLSICHQLAGLMGGSIHLQSTVGVGTTFTMHIPLRYVKERASSTASSSIKSRSASIDAIDIERQRLATPTKPADMNPAPSVLTPQPRLVGLNKPFFAADPTAPPQDATDIKMAEINRAMANKIGKGRLRVLVADDNSTNIEVVSRMLKLEDVYDLTIAKDGQEAFDLVKAAMERSEYFDVIFMDVQMPNVDGLQSTRLIREMGYTSPIVALTAFSEESNVKECMDSGMNEFLAKPIRRPALKQVLKKFATIPEEPELSRQPTEPRLQSGNGTVDRDQNGVLNEKTPEMGNGTAPSVPGVIVQTG